MGEVAAQSVVGTCSVFEFDTDLFKPFVGGFFFVGTVAAWLVFDASKHNTSLQDHKEISKHCCILWKSGLPLALLFGSVSCLCPSFYRLRSRSAMWHHHFSWRDGVCRSLGESRFLTYISNLKKIKIKSSGWTLYNIFMWKICDLSLYVL